MIFPDSPGSELDYEKTSVKEFSKAEEIAGHKSKDEDFDQKLAHSVMENDKEIIEDGKAVMESINRGIGSFTPNIMFDKLVKNYREAERIYGKSLIEYLTGYDESYVKKNIKIPEFQRDIKKKIEENIKNLQERGFIDRQGIVQESAVELATLVLYTEEIDKIESSEDFGEKFSKKKLHYGDKQDVKKFTKDARYRDIALKSSVKLAVRRGHNKLEKEDLKVHERQKKGKIELIYGLDCSGSMKGRKLEMAKKAGVALAYKALQEKDKVGLIVFGSDIIDELAPSSDFVRILRKMSGVRAFGETDIRETIRKAAEMFTGYNVTKHLILLTDAMPTKGEDPQKETLEAAGAAASHGITISIVGINLDKKGEKLAKEIVKLGSGRLYIMKDAENLDRIVLEDYYSLG